MKQLEGMAEVFIWILYWIIGLAITNTLYQINPVIIIIMQSIGIAMAIHVIISFFKDNYQIKPIIVEKKRKNK